MCGSVPKGEEEVVILADRCFGILELRVKRGKWFGAYTARARGEINDMVVPELYYAGTLQALDFRQDVFPDGGRWHGDFEGRALRSFCPTSRLYIPMAQGPAEGSYRVVSSGLVWTIQRDRGGLCANNGVVAADPRRSETKSCRSTTQSA